MPKLPIALYRFHRVLITTAIVFGLVLLGWGLWDYSTHHRTESLASAGAGLTFGVLGVFYLRWFLRKAR